MRLFGFGDFQRRVVPIRQVKDLVSRPLQPFPKKYRHEHLVLDNHQSLNRLAIFSGRHNRSSTRQGLIALEAVHAPQGRIDGRISRVSARAIPLCVMETWMPGRSRSSKDDGRQPSGPPYGSIMHGKA